MLKVELSINKLYNLGAHFASGQTCFYLFVVVVLLLLFFVCLVVFFFFAFSLEHKGLI